MARPRTFDLDQALEQGMVVFWRLGYERATLTDLTEAMGINRPSLYAAFGDKEQLFRKALRCYAEGPACFETDALGQPTARLVVEALLRGAAELQTRRDRPHGCLAALGGPASADDPSSVGRTLVQARAAGEAALRERLERARADGDLPVDADATELAAYVRTVVYGMAVKAASGATRDELLRVVDVAMRAWPDDSLST